MQTIGKVIKIPAPVRVEISVGMIDRLLPVDKVMVMMEKKRKRKVMMISPAYGSCKRVIACS